MKILGWIRQLRHPFATVVGLLGLLIGVLGLSVPGWRGWLTAHALAGWIIAVGLLAVLVAGYSLLDQHVVAVETAHERTRTQLEAAEARERTAAEELRAAKAEPSPNDRRLIAEWREEYPDAGDWRYNLRSFDPKHYTSELTVPMYELAYGHWSDRHFTDSEVESAFQDVVAAAQRFEEGTGAVSQQTSMRNDVAFYKIMWFSDSAGGEDRYRAEIAKSRELAEAVTVAIQTFERAARNRRL